MIPGGYGQVPHAYAFGKSSDYDSLDIRFEKVVEQVTVNPANGKVTVKCEDESGGAYECDAVVSYSSSISWLRYLMYLRSLLRS